MRCAFANLFNAKTIIMKLSLFYLLVLFATSSNIAQVRGSGKIISRTYDYKNFDKVSLTDLSGKIEIEIGKPFSIRADIDDNLLDLLEVEANDPGHLLPSHLK